MIFGTDTDIGGKIFGRMHQLVHMFFQSAVKCSYETRTSDNINTDTYISVIFQYIYNKSAEVFESTTIIVAMLVRVATSNELVN